MPNFTSEQKVWWEGGGKSQHSLLIGRKNLAFLLLKKSLKMSICFTFHALSLAGYSEDGTSIVFLKDELK